jgi:hypothetical protein
LAWLKDIYILQSSHNLLTSYLILLIGNPIGSRHGLEISFIVRFRIGFSNWDEVFCGLITAALSWVVFSFLLSPDNFPWIVKVILVRVSVPHFTVSFRTNESLSFVDYEFEALANSYFHVSFVAIKLVVIFALHFGLPWVPAVKFSKDLYFWAAD